jgi:hypothetical protein
MIDLRDKNSEIEIGDPVSLKYEEIIELQEKEVSKYLKHCPLCYAKSSIEFDWGLRKSYVMCSECGARWHINYGLTGFHWAKLVKVNVEGKGADLLEKEQEPQFWQKMYLEGRKTIEEVAPPNTVREKEIVREVIVKIRCPYCKNLYDETLDKCPHCSAMR